MNLKGIYRFYFLISAFFGEFSVGFMFLTIPLYAYQIGIPYPSLEFGILGGARGIAMILVPLSMGKILSRFHYSKMIPMAFFIGSIMAISHFLSHSYLELLLSGIVLGLFVGLLFPSVEVGILATHHKPSRGLRNFNISWSLASIISPLIAGLIIVQLGIKSPFIIMFLILLSISIIGMLLKRESKKSPLSDDSELTISKRNVKLLLSSGFTMAFIYGIIFTFFPPYAASKGLTAFEIGLIISCMGLANTISHFICTYLIERFDHEKIILGAVPIFGLVPIFITMTNSLLHFLVVFSIIGMLAGTLFSISIIILVGGANKHERGKFAGIFESVLGVGFLIGPSFTGLLVSNYNISPFSISIIAIIPILSAQIYWKFYKS